MARFLTPGCTRAVKFSRSISRILFNRAKPKIMPCVWGKAPPDKPVPAPRATTGTLNSAQILTIFCTCSTVSGRATASGKRRYAAKPSHSYGRMSSSATNKVWLGKFAFNWAIHA